MKLAALFAKFLYQHKELKLPGLGVFNLDPSVPVPDAADKNHLDFTRNIQFRQQPVAQADETFINFIRTETGKIKPLAESDLDSFLSDGKILLNIGKPFHIEGIGYLQKNREGIYEFTPGDATLPKTAPVKEETAAEPVRSKSFYSDEAVETNNSRKILIGVGAIAGIVLVIWLGFILYNRNSTVNAGNNENVAVSEDTLQSNVLLDSVQRKIDSVRNDEVSNTGISKYRFIIERTSNKERAYRRYNQIKKNLTDIKLESRDSVLFQLYFELPAQPADTARIRDSLKTWYGRKIVRVEPN